MLTIWTFIISAAFAIDGQKQQYRYSPIYMQIKKNKPSISHEKAVKLTHAILLNSHEYGINPHLLSAILMQESSYRLNAVNCTNGLDPKTRTPGKVCTDFGIGQIYYTTAQAYGMDESRLTSDLAYSVKMSAKVLSDFKKRYNKKEKDYWTRYNASKPSLRLLYKERVERWL